MPKIKIKTYTPFLALILLLVVSVFTNKPSTVIGQTNGFRPLVASKPTVSIKSQFQRLIRIAGLAKQDTDGFSNAMDKNDLRYDFRFINPMDIFFILEKRAPVGALF